MKLNFPTMTIGGVFVAAIALSSCSVFGSSNEPEEPQVPGFPVDSAETASPVAPPTPVPSLAPEVTPRLAVEDRSISASAESIRGDFAVAVELDDNEAICLDEARISAEDYIGLFEKGEAPSAAAAAAMNGCLTDDRDHELAAWLVEHRFSLDDPSTCFTRELANHVTNAGWVTFVTAVDKEGYAALEPIYLSCGEHASTTTVAAQQTDSMNDDAVLGDVMASVLATTFGLDDASSACLSPTLGSIIDQHGIEALSAAFAGDADDVDLMSPVAQGVYHTIGDCAPVPGVVVDEAAVVGIVRSMGHRVDVAGQACLASEFDQYASVSGIDGLFAGFQDLVRENDTESAIDIAAMINGCVSAAQNEPAEVDTSERDDVGYLTGLAVELNYLDGSQHICLGVVMPGIIEQYGYKQVRESLERATNEIGYQDAVVDAVSLAAFDCL